MYAQSRPLLVFKQVLHTSIISHHALVPCAKYIIVYLKCTDIYLCMLCWIWILSKMIELASASWAAWVNNMHMHTSHCSVSITVNPYSLWTTRPQTSFLGERYMYSDQSVEYLPPSLICYRYGYAKWEAERVITVWPTCNWLLIDPQELNWKRPLTEEGPLCCTTVWKVFVIFLPIGVVHV